MSQSGGPSRSDVGGGGGRGGGLGVDPDDRLVGIVLLGLFLLGVLVGVDLCAAASSASRVLLAGVVVLILIIASAVGRGASGEFGIAAYDLLVGGLGPTVGLVVVAGGFAGGAAGVGALLAGGVGNSDDFVVGFVDFILHVAALGEAVEVVGAEAEEGEGGQDDEDVEGSEEFLLGLLLEGGGVDLAEGGLNLCLLGAAVHGGGGVL